MRSIDFPVALPTIPVLITATHVGAAVHFPECFRGFRGQFAYGPAETWLSPNSQDDERLSKVASAYRRSAPVLEASWQLAGAASLGTLAGWFLDKRLATSPWLMVAGALLGSGTGLALFIRVAIRTSKKSGRKGSP